MSVGNEERTQGSRLLLIFSQQNCIRKRLPDMLTESNHIILLEDRIMKLLADYVLVLRYSKDNWYFQQQRLKEEAPITIVTVQGEKLFLMLSTLRNGITTVGRLNLKQGEIIKIGKAYPNQIFYDYGAQILPQHASLHFHQKGKYIEANGPGIYVNEERVNGAKRLYTGDKIDIYGLHLLIIQDWVICITFCGICHVAENGKQMVAALSENSKEAAVKQQWIERRYEEETSLHKGIKELIAPSQPIKRQENKLFLSLGPTLTMVLPVMLMAVLGNSVMGGQGRGFYALTVVMTACSSFLAFFWGLVNHFYKKHMEKTGEKNRRAQYREYLEQTFAYLQKCREENQKALEQKYPPVNSFLCKEGKHATVRWNRYYMHQDFLFLRMGTGEMPFQIKVKLSDTHKQIVPEKLVHDANAVVNEFSVLKCAPQGIDFYETRRLGLIGEMDENGVYAWLGQLLLQIAACHCYTEVKTVCFYQKDRQAQSAFAACIKWMPHSWSADRRFRYLAGDEQEATEILPILTRELENAQETSDGKRRVPWYLVFVLDEALIQGELLYKYLTEPLGRYPVSTIFVGKEREAIPRCCRSFVHKNENKQEIITYGDETINRIPINPETITFQKAENYVRQISGLRVREEDAGGTFPDQVDFLELYGCSRVEEINCSYRWSKGRPEERLKVPIGCGTDGKHVNLDVHEKFHGPHGLIAGTTGSGKSELLQTYLLSLAISYSPQDVIFFMIDYKGGGTGNILKNLPHCAGVISNLSGNQIKRAMSAISSENKRRQKVLSDFQVNHVDVYTKLYREGKAKEPMPHLILVVDEFAELKKEEPEFMQEIISLAQVGRSLGVHLILATQKPAGTVDDKIWSNARFRLCLRVQDKQDSMDMLHRSDAATLTAPGQCYLQIGNEEYFELFQTAYCGGVYTDTSKEKNGAVLITNTGKRVSRKEKNCTGEAVSKLETLIHYIYETAKENEFAQAKQLWMPELPETISIDEIASKSTEKALGSEITEKSKFLIGLCDDPENQSQFPVSYCPVQQGHLAICGGPATGKSTFLQTILWQLCTLYEPERMQFLLADISRGSLHCFEDMPHCIGILKDREQKEIFFYQLRCMVKKRKEQLAGIGCLQYNRQKGNQIPLIFLVVDGYGSLAQILNEEQMEFMLKIAAEGINYGIYLLVSATGISEIPGRLYEKIKNTLALEMSDPFQYGDTLRQYHISVFPSENIKGRGLCRSNERILEFQTALAYDETDDYARMLRIQEWGKEKLQQRERELKIPIFKFPCIPEKPNYFEMCRRFERKKELSKIPLGYSMTTGELETVDIGRNKCFLISGTEKTGRTNLLYAMTQSLLNHNHKIICLDFHQKLSSLANMQDVIVLTNEQEILSWQSSFPNENIEKHNVSIIISDLEAICHFIYEGENAHNQRVCFWEKELFQKENIAMLVAVCHPGKSYNVGGTGFARKLMEAQCGIHLGGNAGNQNILSFEDLSYTVLNQWEKPGVGYYKEGQGSATHRVLLPMIQENWKLEEKEK